MEFGEAVRTGTVGDAVCLNEVGKAATGWFTITETMVTVERAIQKRRSDADSSSNGGSGSNGGGGRNGGISMTPRPSRAYTPCHPNIKRFCVANAPEVGLTSVAVVGGGTCHRCC
jgi:hypothetical protein